MYGAGGPEGGREFGGRGEGNTGMVHAYVQFKPSLMHMNSIF